MAAILSQCQTAFDPNAAEHPMLKQMRDKLRPQATMTSDGIAVLPVEGVLAHKPDVFEMAWFGMEDSGAVAQAVNDLARNQDVRGILLDVDSPGGFLTGGPEVAEAVKEASKRKPVCAWTGGMMASLAYWIGSAAPQVIASQSAIVGSIGVFTTHIDVSKLYEASGVKVEVIKNKEAAYKAIGAMGTALNDEQRAHLQERIQASFGEFKKAVKGSRPAVSDESMRGQVFSGSEAKRAGLVDRVGGIGLALSALRSQLRNG